MSITFKASSVTIEHRRIGIDVTVDTDGQEIAEQLDIEDRMAGLSVGSIINELGVSAILESIGKGDALAYFGVEIAE